MSHNNGGVMNLREKFISKFENSLSYDDEGDVGQMV
jgi:hypothetical protein